MLNTLLIVLFIVAYALIAFEHTVNINKSAIALISGVLSWMLLMLYTEDHENINEGLMHHVSEISGILFFLLGAMTIVELIDAHNGFDVITQRLVKVKAGNLLLVLGLITFVLSAVLDNLTSTILMISLLTKFMPQGKLRLLYAGFVVIAANAGGAWSPIGDVTTTMLWIGGQVSSLKLITQLIVPSLINLFVPLILLSMLIRKQKLFDTLQITVVKEQKRISRDSKLILLIGLAVLVSVPLFKVIFHLPPFMGILFGLGIMWCITEILNGQRDDIDKHNYSVAYALRHIDTSSILFFLGILLSISALQISGVLTELSTRLSENISSQNTILLLTGFMSAIIDNVPLVAAYQGMYSLNDIGMDDSFWQLLAYCSGTGGSMLIIGSAAGVVAMGIEKISFIWYLKHMSWLAALGYLGGYLYYVMVN